ncbi:MAG: metalloprotease [Christensenellales bacterium]|jgi:stage IV sporulation protein FB
MRNIRVHPFFVVLLLLLLLGGRLIAACSALIAVFVHEWAHYKAAASRGYRLAELTLMPYGALLYSEENIHRQDAFYIASAGIGVNLLLCTIITASWWIAPSTYPLTHPLFTANFALALFNLLPAYPLDGARIILALSKKPIKTLKILKRTGAAIAVILFALFIASAFFQINLTLGIAAVSLFFGSMFGQEKQAYLFISEQNSFLKDRRHPVEEKTICIDKNAPIRRIYPYFDKNRLLTVKITDGATVLAEYGENDFLVKLSGHASEDRVGSIITSDQ